MEIGNVDKNVTVNSDVPVTEYNLTWRLRTYVTKLLFCNSSEATVRLVYSSMSTINIPLQEMNNINEPVSTKTSACINNNFLDDQQNS